MKIPDAFPKGVPCHFCENKFKDGDSISIIIERDIEKGSDEILIIKQEGPIHIHYSHRDCIGSKEKGK